MNKLLVFVIVVILSGHVLQGAELPIIYKVGESSFAVDVSDDFGESVSLVIRDKDGAIVYDDQKNTNYLNRRKYNLRNLPEGEYYVYLQNKVKTVIQTIEIDRDGLQLERSSEEVFFSPYVVSDGVHVDMNFLSPSPTAIRVSLYDNDGNLEFTKWEKVEGNVQRRYNISKIPNGIYRVMVTINDGLINHSYDFDIEK